MERFNERMLIEEVVWCTPQSWRTVAYLFTKFRNREGARDASSVERRRTGTGNSKASDKLLCWAGILPTPPRRDAIHDNKLSSIYKINSGRQLTGTS